CCLPDRNERGARRLRSQQHLLLNAQGLEFFSVCIARIARCASQNPAAFKRSLRLWSFNHRKPFGRWNALTRNGSDPLNAPYPGRTGDKSNLKRQGHGIFLDGRSLTMVISKRSLLLKYLICIDAITLDYVSIFVRRNALLTAAKEFFR